VDDQHGGPTWSRDLAKMAAEVLNRCEDDAFGGPLGEVVGPLGGVYHAAGGGVTTWYEFAAEAVRIRREIEPGARLADIMAIKTAEYPTAARRPANSRLNCNKLFWRFGWKMMDWHESLSRVLSES
jgi:dTDP-4-dehydrorhamnose reductase